MLKWLSKDESLEEQSGRPRMIGSAVQSQLSGYEDQKTAVKSHLLVFLSTTWLNNVPPTLETNY